MSSATVTRKDIDDVLNVLDVMMTRIDERFSKIETTIGDTQKQVQNILNQLTQLHEWIEKAAARIDIKFAH